MTDQADSSRSSMIASVQELLTGFSKQVSTEVQRLQRELSETESRIAQARETLEFFSAQEEKLRDEFAGTTKSDK